MIGSGFQHLNEKKNKKERNVIVPRYCERERLFIDRRA